MKHRPIRVLLLAALVLAALGNGAWARPAAAQPVPRARLEPSRGAYFGVNLNWGADSAQAFNSRLGARAAVYVQFLPFPVSGDAERYLEDFADQVRSQGGLALLTLEPTVPVGEITAEMAGELADRLAAYNRRGVPILVRFAHEMNGSWYPWSQQPSAYVRAFRLLAEAVHARADRTAMLWAPNYGAGYPFRGGRYEAMPDSPEFALLDTNRDGLLDENDDMYAPYYPGDDAVDWVGMTVYHWGDHWPWGKNVLPEPGKFAAQITGTYVGAAGDERAVPDFYAAYAEGHGKPMAIPETSAFFNTTVAGSPELEIKRAWWRQVFSAETARAFPRIRMINWFEWRKPEPEVGGAVVDWTVTSDPAMAGEFVQDLPPGQFLFAGDPAPRGTGTGGPLRP